MPNLLQYTLQKLLETHVVTVEHDVEVRDELGALVKREWQVHSEVKGLFWWWPVRGGAGRYSEHASPRENVFETGGGVLLPLDTTLEEESYRIGKIISTIDGTEVAGPFRIISVRIVQTHMELSLERP